MISTTATTSPAATSSPGSTGIETTTAGAGLRTRPPSSRENRCGAPSTSISRSSPWLEATTRKRWPPSSQHPLVGAEAFGAHLDRVVVEAHPVEARADLADRYPVALPAIPKLDLARRRGLGLGSPAPREGVEGGAIDRGLGIARARPPRRPWRPLRGGPGRASPRSWRRSIQPVSISPERTSGRASRSSRKPTLVVPPSTTIVVSARARRRRARASPRSSPQAISLAIIESNSAGIESPSRHPGVDPDPGSAGEAEQRRSARAPGAKPSSGSSALIRASIAWPTGAGGVSLEPAARGDVELELQQVEPGGRLGDRVLDLKAGVDLHEREQPLLGLEEELDGRRAAVAGPQRQPHRRLAAASAPARRRAPGCSTPRSTFWFRRWRLQSRTPTAQAVPWPSAISCTSTWRAGSISFSSRTASSPKASRASARALRERRLRARSGSVDPADPAPAAARRRLDQQRIADPLGVRDRLRRGLPTAPPLQGATGRPASSASRFAATLSPSSRIALALGPTKTTPSRSQSSAKSGCSATKPQPTQAASARGWPAPTRAAEVEVAVRRSVEMMPPGRGSTPRRLADEHRLVLGRGVERDQGDRVLGLAR